LVHNRNPMSKLFTAIQIKKIDTYTIENEPVLSIDLMERAAGRLAEWIMGAYTDKRKFKLFIGPGNNGGDGLALARILWLRGYENLEIFILKISATLSTDSEINLQRLPEQVREKVILLETESNFPEIHSDEIIIDALFGTGLSRPLEGLSAKLVMHLNSSPVKDLLAIDMPSGLFAEDNSKNLHECIIKASNTFTFQFPKLAFFFPENSEYVGRWQILNIGLHPEAIQMESTPYHFISEEDIVERIHIRRKFSHKGSYGHALLIAGSYGMMGAAILSARSAIRAGAGLITAHVPRCGVEIMHTSVPEVLVSADSSEQHSGKHPLLENFTAIGIGPGLGKNPTTKQGLIKLLKKTKVPVVIDADGLNLLADTDDWIGLLPGHSILTPHPREFERLFGSFSDSYSRLQAQLKFSVQHKCVVVLKGAHTCITTSGGIAWFNSTGNPGMAKGGSGDVLTGLILGLLAQGYGIDDASLLAVYIHGYAGDLAARELGQYAMLPSDIVNFLGTAFNTFEKKKESL
jgi:ADP-dependent NAD(P)H-hydrate dehydratase / NAD(P)H-hydrate epimerase